MCTVCGCDGEGATIEKNHKHTHDGHHEHSHREHGHDDHSIPHHHHNHAHTHVHAPSGALDFGAGPAGVHVPGQSQTRLIEIERDILSKNDGLAAANRQMMDAMGILAINMVSSPGSGKTTLLVETIKALAGEFPVAVIEGDQQTSNDADRIRATG
ncbi:MAG: GTP-binding protein, partial [Pseudomonadota bacterium]